MTSGALTEWNRTRSTGLDRLVDAHRAVAGTGPGRRWITVEINHALIVRLASEFQGFCRDLHDETARALVAGKLPADPRFAALVRVLLTSGRRLDRGNASWANVCEDFGRFGISLADELRRHRPRRYAAWTRILIRLNEARNAIAHDDRTRLAECAAAEPLTLGTFRRWRNGASAMAHGMDAVLDAYLQDMLDAAGSAP